MILRIKDILVSFNKEQLYMKIQKGLNLVEIFKKKINSKKQQKKDKQNDTDKVKDNIVVKSIKMTPSGLIPMGWNKDLRNRLSRNYPNNDFQFLRLEVTNDDSEKTHLYNGGEIFTKILFNKIKTINIMDF